MAPCRRFCGLTGLKNYELVVTTRRSCFFYVFVYLRSHGLTFRLTCITLKD
nr:MAG TPA: hypothetical protein [Caudoviricetes sp.]